MFLVTAAVLSMAGTRYASAYVLPLKTGFHRSNTLLRASHDAQFSEDDTACLKRRLQEMRVQILDEEMRRPPNSSLDPQSVVQELLRALRNPDDPLPDAGFRLLLWASSPKWRNSCFKSVGAPMGTNAELVASALGDAIGRPNNQFGILIDENYKVSFPREPVYNNDDCTCWLECQLRNEESNDLLVTIGLQLWERPSDGAWMLHRIDWQDFRERFRPGIGREDWMRDTMRRLGCL